MRYAIFADVHGNLEAFEAVLAAFKTESLDGYFFVGDIVGYGANPSECIAKLKELKAVCVAGNHDWAVVNKKSVEYFNPAAQRAVLWTQERMTQGEFDFLSSMELVVRREFFVLVHGTLQNPAQFYYMMDFYQAARTFRLMDRPLCFVGHSHLPGIFAERNNVFSPVTGTRTMLKDDHRYIVNVGSVGQPRDNDPRACYCVYDEGKKEIAFKRVDYDIEKAQNKILKAGLPESLAFRLATGE